MLRRINFSGNPNLGVYISVTDNVALVPFNTPEILENTIKEALEVDVIKTPIAGSGLIGALAVGNSNGILVSNQILDKEMETMKNAGLNVAKLPDKHTAVGNIIIANDNGAIVSPYLSKKAIDTISDVLDVDVKSMKIAEFSIVGSIATVTNKGAILHPQTSENELKLVEDVLKVPADIGTVNRGVGLIGACSSANSNGIIVGELTTGPEMARLEEALGFLEGYL